MKNALHTIMGINSLISEKVQFGKQMTNVDDKLCKHARD